MLGLVALVPLLTVPLVLRAQSPTQSTAKRMLLLSDVALAARHDRADRQRAAPRIRASPALFVFGGAGSGRLRVFSAPPGTRSRRALSGPDQLTAAIAVEDVVFNPGARRRAGDRAVVLIGDDRPRRASYAVDLRLPSPRRCRVSGSSRRVPAAPDADRPSLRAYRRRLRCGWRKKQSLLGIFAVDTVAMIFGMPSCAVSGRSRRSSAAAPSSARLHDRRPWAGALLRRSLSGWVAGASEGKAWGLNCGRASGASRSHASGFAGFGLARAPVPRGGGCRGLFQRRSPVVRSSSRRHRTAMRGRLSGYRARPGRRRARDSGTSRRASWPR